MTQDVIEQTDLAVESTQAQVKRLVELETIAPTDPFPGDDERPCYRVYDIWIIRDGRKLRPGVYHHGLQHKQGNAIPFDEWVCAPLHVDAITTNAEDGEHGRLLRFISATGIWKKWAMPMSMLASDGTDMRGVLLDDGLTFNTSNRGLITAYIGEQHPKQRLKAATVTGWHGGAFVLPDEVIGADNIWFQAAGRTAPYGTAGTMKGWQDNVAALATGNPALILAICTALAGPLLESLNIDGGGIHLYGDSSTGKTTALMAAISVWGGPKYRRTWRATSNGLEGAAKLHTATLLALDEIGEVSPRDLYEATYALCNGSGKGRANVYGEARDVARWRVFILSTGEVTLASRMAAGGIDAKAGQAVRLLDIPIAGKYGLFDELHGKASGAALSQVIRDAAAQDYGHAGRAFVTALINDLKEDFNVSQALEAIQARFGQADGQDGRGARLLAVCALAGEHAIKANILPWQQGSAIDAAVATFKLWRDGRATTGQGAEHAAILKAVADFIDKHGDSRFSDVGNAQAQVRDRAGYTVTDPVRRYLFTSGGLQEATKGYDLKRVVQALSQAGALDSEAGRKTKTTRTPDGRLSKLYHVDPEKLEIGHA